MADDNIDFRFLGQQVKSLQADVRDLRSGHLRRESDVVGMRADISRIEAHIGELAQPNDNHHRANQAQFAQLAQTATTNLQIILAELTELKRKYD
jgi:hypothetical protein